MRLCEQFTECVQPSSTTRFNDESVYFIDQQLLSSFAVSSFYLELPGGRFVVPIFFSDIFLARSDSVLDELRGPCKR